MSRKICFGFGLDLRFQQIGKYFFEGSRCTILFADAQFCFQPVDAVKQGMEIMIIVRHEAAQAMSIDKIWNEKTHDMINGLKG
ncbi:MAG: hypothetical protein AMJ45_05515 [Syntrophobacter sp. DG_60]|nr:MAG: hypothetical protein AMJ45_05515 [Syntrophobacter sp. DG_60]